MQFTKMHGIGNDYVYIDGFTQSVADPSRLAVKMSDRHFGVGADGLILVLPPDDKGQHAADPAHVRMRIFNADGSEAEMCGNGIRCVCKLAHDQSICRAQPMRIQTTSGVLTLRYTTGTDGNVDRVTVDMGRPILEPAQIPVDLAARAQLVDEPVGPLIQWPDELGRRWLDDSGLDRRMTCVSMGNPHAIFFCRAPGAIPLKRVGPFLEHHRLFPHRINVHFVQVQGPAMLKMRTWERGSGVTLACGTGASAVCVAAVLTGRSGRAATIRLPGGDLSLRWSDKDDHVYMTGPAVEVFSGHWHE